MWALVLINVFALLILVVVWRYLGSEWFELRASLVILVLVGLWLDGLILTEQFYNERVITCTVEEKDRGGSEGGYRVYTEECGVFTNRDAWFRGKFDSADLWTEIPDSGTIEVRVVGARIPLFSSFPNILEVTPRKE